MVGDEIKLLLHNVACSEKSRSNQKRKGLEEVNEKTVAKDQLRNVTFKRIFDYLQWEKHVCINSNLFMVGKSQAFNAMINNVTF